MEILKELVVGNKKLDTGLIFTLSSELPRVGLRAALRGRRSRPRPAKAVNRSLSSILRPGLAGLTLVQLVDGVCPHSYKKN